MASEVVSVKEAAAQLGVTPKTAWEWIKKGRLKGYKLDPRSPRGRYRVYRDSVEALLRERDKKTVVQSGIAMLESAAAAGDEAAFVRAAGEIDWSRRTAVDFIHAVHLALAAGAHLCARNLAAQGAEQYPDYAELQKMARILAPARVVRSDLPPVPSVRVNQDWLRAHADEYKGRWVALRDGILLAVASTLGELKAQLGTLDGILVTKVF
jgi:excisionase family DNA binding protein